MYSRQGLGRFSGLLLALAGLLLLSVSLVAQTTVGTGSIVGTVTDPTGAVVSGAKVSITNVATGQSLTRTSNASGAYNSGALNPGNYKVQISAKGFNTVSMPVTVLVGNTATANARLAVGQESQVVEVQASEVQVNTEQPTVQGVLNAQQIENLPVNGRNFLDLAQLEPGVQIQDGTNFDPTKVGYSSISFGGRFGRTARIEVDGVDVSDETVGTTTTDIPASAIQEFQLSQSDLDLSSELTSSGAVNVTTRSGTNGYHGEGFYLFRDSRAAAALPHPAGLTAPFQRNQYGGRFGGPIKKDKLFFFMDAERTLQHLQAPVEFAEPFTPLSTTYPAPFRENNVLGRVDYQITKSARAFYRYTYFDNGVFATFFPASLQVYDNKDFTRTHVVGIDFNTGSFTHSIRFEYLKFQNEIADAVRGSSIPGANLPVSIDLGFLGNPTGVAEGTNYLAPQSTPQSNHQIKYDGSKVIGSHILRWGVDYNHLQGGGFAGFFALNPHVGTFSIGTSEIAFANQNLYGPGGAANPLNYPLEWSLISNGQGFSTEFPAMGFPAGGLGPDNRIGLYLGDSWKVKPNFTLSAGVRWDRDTGRTDSDLPAIPELNAAFPGWGNPVRQPNSNIAPQLGFAWDPWNNGKTSIRAGIGLFYENVIWNNVLFDRPLRLKKGAFLQTGFECLFGSSIPQPVPGGTVTAPQSTCGTPSGGLVPIGSVMGQLAQFEQQFQSMVPFNPNAANGSYIGSQLQSGLNIASALFAPNYRTPRSVQMNIGVQREIKPGMVFSADFVRNVTTHYLLGVDINHTGDARFFNQGAAAAAINTTNAAFGCPAGQAGVDCAIKAGASMVDYAGNGLTSPADPGGACPQNLGVACAFPGINPNYGQMFFLQPIGRSVYDGLQMKLTENVKGPVRGIHNMNLQISYALSRFTNAGGTNPSLPGNSDQDFVISAIDNNNPLGFSGPSLLDRTHQLSFGGFLDLPAGFRAGVISHFYSALPQSMVVPATGNPGEIFRTDFTGDGTTGDLLPGTSIGNFDRGINAGSINNALMSYNNTVAGQATPAGKDLINAGLMTLAQLQALGGVAPQVPLAPAGQVNMDWLRAFDFNLSWSHTFNERLTVTPSIGIYNAFNFANFDLPPGVMVGNLDGSKGSIDGTTYADRVSNRVGLGTGVFGLGAPRVMEFGMKLTF